MVSAIDFMCFKYGATRKATKKRVDDVGGIWIENYTE